MAWLLPSFGALAAPTPAELAALANIKAAIYTGITDQQAIQIAAGTAQPFIHRTTGAQLPSLHFQWRVPSSQAAGLAAVLPAGLTLAKARILARKAPHYWLVLSVFDVSGEENGIRAQWSTFVTVGPDPQPRRLILDHYSSTAGLDPVHINTPVTAAFDYAVLGGQVDLEITDGAFAIDASISRPAKAKRVRGSLDWSAADDKTYWSNGVADRLYYNSLLAARDLERLSRRQVTVDVTSPWLAFAAPRLQRVLIDDGATDYAVGPWFNADDPSLGLDPAFVNLLTATKASAFSAIHQQRSIDLETANAEPLAAFTVEDAPPSIYLNFPIKPGRVEDLAAAIPLPPGFELAKLKTVRGSRAMHQLTLNVYLTSGLTPGLRAEWSVYVSGPDVSEPRYMIVEALSDTASLDPVNQFTLPAAHFTYGVVGGVGTMVIQDGDTSFAASFEIPASPRLTAATAQWVEANNDIYWTNGVADKIHYDGLTYLPQLTKIPAKAISVTDETPWAEYLDAPKGYVYPDRIEFLVSPWNNLSALAGP